jgi:hypothetical protein
MALLGLPCRFLANHSNKMVTLRMSIQQHVPGFKDKRDYPNFVIARRHFPRVLLECRAAWKIKAGTTFLSTVQAELLITKRDIFGSGRFKENCNKVSRLLAKAGRSNIESSDGNKFVQAPVVTKSRVEELVKKLLTPSRLQWRKERGESSGARSITKIDSRTRQKA